MRYSDAAGSYTTTTMYRRFYPLSLHDALPICPVVADGLRGGGDVIFVEGQPERGPAVARSAERYPLPGLGRVGVDLKSTRLNSSHPSSSYAVFCLQNKKAYPHRRKRRAAASIR